VNDSNYEAHGVFNVHNLSKRIVYVGANIVRPKLEEFDKIIEKRDNYSAGRTMFAPTTLTVNKLEIFFEKLLHNIINLDMIILGNSVIEKWNFLKEE